MTRPYPRRDLDRALELMYYGFKRLVEHPDRLLARRRLNRVHHRVLYFLARDPDCSMGELLEHLGVTKQALHGPLRDLIREKLVVVSSDRVDRRVRRLAPSSAGTRLESHLTGIQHASLARIFDGAGKRAGVGWTTVMRLMAERPALLSEPASPSASSAVRRRG